LQQMHLMTWTQGHHPGRSPQHAAQSTLRHAPTEGPVAHRTQVPPGLPQWLHDGLMLAG
jgi:hypothetical protein